MAQADTNFKLPASKSQYAKDFSQTAFSKLGSVIAKTKTGSAKLKSDDVRELVADEIRPGLTSQRLEHDLGAEAGIIASDRKKIINLLRRKYGVVDNKMSHEDIGYLTKEASQVIHTFKDSKKFVKNAIMDGLTLSQARERLKIKERRIRTNVILNREGGSQQSNMASHLSGRRAGKGSVSQALTTKSGTKWGHDELGIAGRKYRVGMQVEEGQGHGHHPPLATTENQTHGFGQTSATPPNKIGTKNPPLGFRHGVGPI
jgi:hypothetical protein